MNRESRRKGTWSTEANGPDFRGASDSVIEGHRPNISLDPGRKSNWPLVLLAFVILIGGLGGAGWFFRDDIAAIFEGDATDTDADTDAAAGDESSGDASVTESGATGETGETGATAATGDSAETSAATGSTGATGPSATSGASVTPATGAAAAGTGGSGLPHAWPPRDDQRYPSAETGESASASGGDATGDGGGAAPTPTTGGTGNDATPSSTLPPVSLVELKVSGISTSRAESNLGDPVEYAKACLETLGPDAARVSGELSIRMTIKWNGRASGVSVSGDGLPSALKSCVRGKLPKARYPQPRPGKDGAIRGTLKIGK